MKITPVAVPQNSVNQTSEGGTSIAQKIRTLKMSTIATPERLREAPEGALTGAQKPENPQELAKIDTNSETAQPAQEVTQPLSPQLAALAKQRRALQVKEREIAEREKALAGRHTTSPDAITKEQLKDNPLGVLLDAGVTYDQLTEAIIANQNGITPEVKALQEKLKSLEEGIDKKLSEREAAQEQAALKEMEREARLLSSQGDEFELVRETKSVPLVVKLIERTYREHGEVMDVREAMQAVETELLNTALQQVNLKKVQSKIAPTEPSQPTQQSRQPIRTLTNRDTASIPMSRKARAIAAFNGTLKQ